MDNSFWGILWKHLRSIPGFLVGMMIALSSIPLKLFGISDDVELLICLPIIGTLVLLLVACFLAYCDLYNRKISVLPKVIRTITGIYENDNAVILLLLEPSEIFSHQIFVSVYYLEDKFEELIGIGSVVNIQGDGIIQVNIEQVKGSYQKIKTGLENNNAIVLDKIIVKPNIPNTQVLTKMIRG